MSKIYFVRHGQSEANADGMASSKTVQLTEVGMEQARAAGSKLTQANIGCIVTSPLIRAQQTAGIIAEEIGYAGEIVTMNELSERDLGSYIGQPRPDDRDFFYAINDDNGVEPRSVLLQRAESVLNQMRNMADETDGNILAVGHAIIGFFMRQIAAGVTNYDEFDWNKKIANGDVIEIEFNS